MTEKARISTPASSHLRNLSRRQVKMIDEALGSIGKFGEVRLVVDKGRLRFLVTQTSHDMMKYRPGRFKC